MWHIKNCEHREDAHAYAVTCCSELRSVSLLLIEEGASPEQHVLFISEGSDPWKKETRLETEYEEAWGHRLRSLLADRQLQDSWRADLSHMVDSLEHHLAMN